MIGSALVAIVSFVFRLTALTILAQVLLSWVLYARIIDPSQPSYSTLVRIHDVLRQITDPILSPIRRFATFGMMDFSPIVAMFLLEIIREILIRLLLG